MYVSCVYLLTLVWRLLVAQYKTVAGNHSDDSEGNAAVSNASKVFCAWENENARCLEITLTII